MNFRNMRPGAKAPGLFFVSFLVIDMAFSCDESQRNVAMATGRRQTSPTVRGDSGKDRPQLECCGRASAWCRNIDLRIAPVGRAVGKYFLSDTPSFLLVCHTMPRSRGIGRS